MKIVYSSDEAHAKGRHVPQSHNHGHRKFWEYVTLMTDVCQSQQECSKGAQYLGIEKMSVDHSPLDVIEVGVVLQSTLQEACLFTELGDVCPIIMSKHLISKNGICNL